MVPACADSSPVEPPSEVDETQGAASTAPSITKGSWEYLFRAREGLIRKLVLRDNGTFERTFWVRQNGRLVQRSVSGTFTTASKRMPTFVRKLLRLRGADGSNVTLRFREELQGELHYQPDSDDALSSSLQLMETSAGRRAVYASCRATKVEYDVSPLEESFSTNEYPDVDIYEKPGGGYSSVDIGSQMFNTQDGDRIAIDANGSNIEARVDRGQREAYIVRVAGTEGTVLHGESGRVVPFATLKCKRP